MGLKALCNTSFYLSIQSQQLCFTFDRTVCETNKSSLYHHDRHLFLDDATVFNVEVIIESSRISLPSIRCLVPEKLLVVWESSVIRLFRPYDLLYFVDFVILIAALMKKIKMDQRPVKARMAFAISTLAVMIFSGNLFLAEADRPELLTRTFSRDYLVKYLGINAFTVYDEYASIKLLQVRAEASPSCI